MGKWGRLSVEKGGGSREGNGGRVKGGKGRMVKSGKKERRVNDGTMESQGWEKRRGSRMGKWGGSMLGIKGRVKGGGKGEGQGWRKRGGSRVVKWEGLAKRGMVKSGKREEVIVGKTGRITGGEK